MLPIQQRTGGETMKEIEKVRMMKKYAMEFEELGYRERRLLLKALGYDLTKPMYCDLCHDKAYPSNCAIMPPLDNKKLVTILCGSIVCTAKYLELKDEAVQQCKKMIFMARETGKAEFCNSSTSGQYFARPEMPTHEVER